MNKEKKLIQLYKKELFVITCEVTDLFTNKIKLFFDDMSDYVMDKQEADKYTLGYYYKKECIQPEKMNFWDAIKYLEEDEDNKVFCLNEIFQLKRHKELYSITKNEYIIFSTAYFNFEYYPYDEGIKFECTLEEMDNLSKIMIFYCKNCNQRFYLPEKICKELTNLINKEAQRNKFLEYYKGKQCKKCCYEIVDIKFHEENDIKCL